MLYDSKTTGHQNKNQNVETPESSKAYHIERFDTPLSLWSSERHITIRELTSRCSSNTNHLLFIVLTMIVIVVLYLDLVLVGKYTSHEVIGQFKYVHS
jgi:hypothetical protein